MWDGWMGWKCEEKLNNDHWESNRVDLCYSFFFALAESLSRLHEILLFFHLEAVFTQEIHTNRQMNWMTNKIKAYFLICIVCLCVLFPKIITSADSFHSVLWFWNEFSQKSKKNERLNIVCFVQIERLN